VVQSSFEASNPRPMSFNPWSSLTFFVLNNIAAIHLKEINSGIPSIEYTRVRYQSPFIQRTFVLIFNFYFVRVEPLNIGGSKIYEPLNLLSKRLFVKRECKGRC
jgi:hypothetical protein